MRILLLTHSFNSLAQRLFVELTALGHEISVEFDIADAVTVEAVQLFQPELVIAPYLKRAIPASVWQRHVCLVVHPGIPGDRGPSSLDWALVDGEREWGVTVLQANAAMDAGDIWAWRGFPMRAARKGSLYRNEVTEAAVHAVREAVARFAAGEAPRPQSAWPALPGRARPPMRQQDRRIHWARDDTATVLRKIHAADGCPGVADTLLGLPVRLYDACAETRLRGAPGEVIARRHGAICRATADGAVWIGHLKREDDPERAFKLPAALALEGRLEGVPESPVDDLSPHPGGTWRDIWYEEREGVGFLHFDFYNGAMGSEACLRLRDAFRAAARRDTRVIVLMGGADFWSNGIHLNLIEAAESPADESWRNIEAMDDLAREIIECGSQLTVAALQGNAGAGGAFLALAADRVWARRGVILNPHYKNMGNLYGSEYWTYLLPQRVGAQRAQAITDNRLPIGSAEALALGLLDDAFGDDPADFRAQVARRATALAHSPQWERALAARRARRAADEARKPLARYREEELERMKLNFYGFDPSYHVARYHFVFRVPHAWTPLHLALHRRGDEAGRGARRPQTSPRA